MTNTITLKALDTVRHANWNGCTARVNTARAYAIENERCPDKAERTCREFGHDVVWTMYSGGTLMSDGPAKDAHYAKLDAEFARAVVLADGDTVEIEGKIYTVKFNRGNTGEFPTNCDPIRFVSVKQQIADGLAALGAEMDKQIAELDAADEADEIAARMFGKGGAA